MSARSVVCLLSRGSIKTSTAILAATLATTLTFVSLAATPVAAQSASVGSTSVEFLELPFVDALSPRNVVIQPPTKAQPSSDVDPVDEGISPSNPVSNPAVLARLKSRCGYVRMPSPTRAQTRVLRSLPQKMKSIAIVGDSLIRRSYVPFNQAMLNQGILPTVACKAGERIQWGLKQLRTIDSRKRLPARVVIALGVNDLKSSSFASTVSRVKQMNRWLRSKKKRVWWVEAAVNTRVMSKARKAKYKRVAALNKLMRSQSRTLGSRFRVIQWSRYAAGREFQTFISDGIHLTPYGEQRRNKLIVRSIS